MEALHYSLRPSEHNTVNPYLDVIIPNIGKLLEGKERGTSAVSSTRNLSPLQGIFRVSPNSATDPISKVVVMSEESLEVH